MKRLLVVALALVACAPAAAEARQYSSVEYFGYFAARLTPSGGNHLAEVADRSNLNWVQISDVDRYRPEVLDGCRLRGCIVSTGHEFFTGCDSANSPNCNLYPNHRDRWLRLAQAIGPRIGRVGAFYLLDEPQFRGASPAEVAQAARTIKQTFPSIPVMMVEAGPKVTESLQVPAEVDWAGFDWYCQPFSTIVSKLGTLERRTAAHQRLVLLPESAPLSQCGGKPGHRTDAEIAALQWDYFRLAEAHPRVIGLLAFGLWTSGHDSAELPRTVAAHRQIAARVIRPPALPAAANRAPAITRLKVRKRIRRSRARTRVTTRRKRQSISFSLSEAATVTLVFQRLRRGARGRKVRLAGRRGTNRVVFQGRLSRRRFLVPGRYRVTVTARDAGGARAKPRRARFRLVRR